MRLLFTRLKIKMTLSIVRQVNLNNDVSFQIHILNSGKTETSFLLHSSTQTRRQKRTNTPQHTEHHAPSVPCK